MYSISALKHWIWHKEAEACLKTDRAPRFHGEHCGRGDKADDTTRTCEICGKWPLQSSKLSTLRWTRRKFKRNVGKYRKCELHTNISPVWYHPIWYLECFQFYNYISAVGKWSIWKRSIWTRSGAASCSDFHKTHKKKKKTQSTFHCEMHFSKVLFVPVKMRVPSIDCI